MVMHRTALRLRGLIPVLLSQNTRQLNRPQSSWPTDFEGSLFNRLLCQGSGLHPQTGSPQNQWAFSFAQESWNRLAACSSGVLAVLFGSGQSPVVGYVQYLGHHHDFRFRFLGNSRISCRFGFRGSFNALSLTIARAVSITMPGSLCVSIVQRRSINASSESALFFRNSISSCSFVGYGPSMSSSTSTVTSPPELSESTISVTTCFHIFSVEIPKCFAAKLIVICMDSTVVHRLLLSAYLASADFGQFGVDYFQNMNQGDGLGAGAALSAFVNWLIWPSRNVIRSLALARSAFSCSTSAPSVSRAAVSSGMSINHLLSTMVPVSNRLVNLRLMVFGETPRAIAASCIESCMTPMVNHRGYAEPRLSVNPSPSSPRLSKYWLMASVGALRPGAGRPVAL